MPETCCLCKDEYNGYGNNAKPLAVGRCCNDCNEKVIVWRIISSTKEQTNRKNI